MPSPFIVTLFGGSGFIGRAIVNQLLRDMPGPNLQIRIATRNPDKADFLRQLGEVGQVTPVLCDPKDASQVERVVAGSAAVINCIGQLAESRGNRFDTVQGEIPGVIARAVLTVAHPKNEKIPRLIHLSAIGADANSPSLYARSKAAGEGVVRAILPAATILRPSIVFGPEDRFFNRFARMALLSYAMPVLGGGYTKFQPVYVVDVARAVVQVLRNPVTQGATFELGGPATYNFADLMRLLLKVIDRKRHLFVVPWNIALLKGAILEMLPGKILTRDQVKLLQIDNVANDALPGLTQLGVTPTAVEAVIPTYLDRFKPRGRFR